MAWRHFTLVGFFLLASIALVVRVVYLNVTEGQFLIDQGERRSIKSQEVAAHRGVVYDRFGEPLQDSITSHKLTACFTGQFDSPCVKILKKN